MGFKKIHLQKYTFEKFNFDDDPPSMWLLICVIVKLSCQYVADEKDKKPRPADHLTVFATHI